MHFFGQAFDLADRLADHAVTGTRFVIGASRGMRSLLGVARHFLNGGGHFVHGGGDLVGLDLLAVGTGAGLLGHRRQLFGGAGNLSDAVTDAADQFAQGRPHARNALLQHADFIATGNAQVVGQVATGNAFHGLQGIAQRAGDLVSDDHCSNDASQQRQQRGDGLQAAGLGAFCVATLQLDVVQRVAALDDIGALHGHLGAGNGDVGNRIAELAHGIAVGLHRLLELLDTGGFSWQLALEVVDIGQGAFQLAQGGLLVGGTVVGNVTAHVDTHLQQLLARLADQLVLGQAHTVWLGAGHDVLAEDFHGLIGPCRRHVHCITGGQRTLVAGAHLVQRYLVLADGLPQLLEQHDVGRAGEGGDQVLLLLAEGVELGLGVGSGGVIAIGDHVLQTRDAQVGQILVELTDVTHPVAAVNQPAQAGPAGQGQQAG